MGKNKDNKSKKGKKGKSQGERARGKEQKPELSTAKKVGKLFKVATTNNKIAQKKTKEIPKKLKNVS